MRKTALPLLAALWLLSPGAALLSAFAQVPPPVPALPDSERRTSYSITATTCACAVNFALYGDSTDYQNWVEVWLNGVNVPFGDPTFGWAITSPTGPLATIPRPITNGVLTFTNAQTGTVQIVGARRPRRTSQFSENRGVAARDLNQAMTDIIAQNRETWDKINDFTGRALIGSPGSSFAPLPPASVCANKFILFDPTGLIPTCSFGSGAVNGPGSTTIGDFALWANNVGTALGDSFSVVPIAKGGTGQATAPASRGFSGINIESLCSNLTCPGDANYAILNTDRVIQHTALSAARTDTLPAANTMNPGQTLAIVDFAGVASASHSISVQRSGSDTIDGVTSATVVNSQYGAAYIWSDGVSKWTYFQTASSGMGTVVSVGTNGFLSGGPITTSGTVSASYLGGALATQAGAM